MGLLCSRCVCVTVGASNVARWQKPFGNSQLLGLFKTMQVYKNMQSSLIKQHEGATRRQGRGTKRINRGLVSVLIREGRGQDRHEFIDKRGP